MPKWTSRRQVNAMAGRTTCRITKSGVAGAVDYYCKNHTLILSPTQKAELTAAVLALVQKEHLTVERAIEQLAKKK